ncbi:uncharacterized protein AMSG_07675 [Thecamonas trahens ATCC 50062]|uniref:Uncharacterized protein n=1 Tax=Thecamonas trahens ATCC 50062 TaxID=461836 RepID=A0A0L0DJJ9_THETB|nr:hypothetical protein AMSG_07675 [Thecamonas trahens ATCC 50062]KNC51478.1 hypothetical protein AMSG_07675 [Thecamonas trahens ATCC 50062]|eukprot:XP_013756139.1 hypothetical protein AMSG_07675 [Thecamonas trahens ATCC 50062]
MAGGLSYDELLQAFRRSQAKLAKAEETIEPDLASELYVARAKTTAIQREYERAQALAEEQALVLEHALAGKNALADELRAVTAERDALAAEVDALEAEIRVLRLRLTADVEAKTDTSSRARRRAYKAKLAEQIELEQQAIDALVHALVDEQKAKIKLDRRAAPPPTVSSTRRSVHATRSTPAHLAHHPPHSIQRPPSPPPMPHGAVDVHTAADGSHMYVL